MDHNVNILYRKWKKKSESLIFFYITTVCNVHCHDPSSSSDSGPPLPARPPEIFCCIINISGRVGVNGPVFKLTFISLIHTPESAALCRPGSENGDALWFTLAMQRGSHDPGPSMMIVKLMTHIQLQVSKLSAHYCITYFCFNGTDALNKILIVSLTIMYTNLFRIPAWDISSEICWFYQNREKAARADIWSFHTINHKQGRVLRIFFNLK